MEIDTWYDEELIPDESNIADISKSASTSTVNQSGKAVRGLLRVDRPRWRELDTKQHQLAMSSQDSRFLLIRLGFQFDIEPDERRKGVQYTFARCKTYLRPAYANDPYPIVYELIPRDLYEGEPSQVSLKLGPKINIGAIEASLGEISTDITVGTVEPVIIGWPGENECAPYWEINPKTKSLLGVRHFWLIVELPQKCRGVQIATMVEGEMQTKFGPIAVGPRQRSWDKRISEKILLYTKT